MELPPHSLHWYLFFPCAQMALPPHSLHLLLCLRCAHFARFAKGAAAPEVQRGAVLASSNFWHGPALLGWARDWVAYWTEGRSPFVASAMS
jgi:hypothetical protein